MLSAEISIAPSSLRTDFLGSLHDLSCWGPESDGKELMFVWVHGIELFLVRGGINFFSGWVVGIEEFIDGFSFSTSFK